MTLAEASEVFTYWEQNPPAHLVLQTIARLLGWAPRVADDGAAAAAALTTAPPPGVAVVRGGDLGMPAPILNTDGLREHNQVRARQIAADNQARRKG